MNTAEHLELASEKNITHYEELLLPPDQGFRLYKANNKEFCNSYHIIYRAPVFDGYPGRQLIVVNTIDVGKLNRLRVEQAEGKSYVVTDKVEFREGVRFAVSSEKLAFEIVKAIVEIELPDDSPSLPKKLKGVNRLVRQASESVITISVSLVCMSATFWFLTH